MSEQLDVTVRELGSTQLVLRDDLAVTPDFGGAQRYYVIEDPLNSRFFRLGEAEYTFVTLLDGSRTLQDAFQQLSTALPHHRLTEADVAGMCRWLVELELVRNADVRSSASRTQPSQRTGNPASWTQWNPVFFRVPLAWPDAWFEKLIGHCGWIYSWPMGVLWLVLLVTSLYQIGSRWEQFAGSSQGMFAQSNWIWLGLCWVALKLVHELSHGMVCKRYGGTVREVGLLVILLAPLAYVDVTSSWRFRSRWQRIHVAAAGMYIELLIAAGAGLLWSRTDPGWLNNLCYNVVVTAGVSTILFNANPLMRFDGYFILSDLLGIPNLSTLGPQYLTYLCRRYLCGVAASPPCWPEGKGTIVRVYAVASLIWRCVACTGMTVAAAALFHGAGVLLAVAAVISWLGLPALQAARYLIRGKPGERPDRVRFLATTVTAAAASVFVLAYFPWPGVRHAPAVVDYSPAVVIRAESPGFVRRIHVTGGQLVQAGQLLAELENDELSRDLAQLELEIRQSELRERQHEQKGQLAAQQAEAKNRESLMSKRNEKKDRVDQLAVKAPVTGRVVRRNLGALVGTYLKTGDEILTLGNEDRKELQVSIAQDDLEAYIRRIGQPLRVDLPCQPIRKDRLEKIIPRASLVVTHPALAAVHGGKLPTRPAARRAAEERSAQGEDYELFAPRFTGIVALDAATSRSLHVGQTGSVSCQPMNESIGQHLYYSFYRWVLERIKQATVPN